LDGLRSEYLTVAPSVVKFGLSDHSDLQVGFTPYAHLQVKGAGTSSHTSGFGDVVVRYKHRLSRDGAPVQFGLIPFVKLPTASQGLGNDKVEGGLALPIGFSLGHSITAVIGPEADWLADGHGHHFGVVNLINLSGPIAPRVTFAAELWSNYNFDPGGTVRQASADAAIAYLATKTLQLDAGINFGLTKDTPDVEVYAGSSVRF
jgi:hypothetical protein